MTSHDHHITKATYQTHKGNGKWMEKVAPMRSCKFQISRHDSFRALAIMLAVVDLLTVANTNGRQQVL